MTRAQGVNHSWYVGFFYTFIAHYIHSYIHTCIPISRYVTRECLENGNLQVLPQAGGKMILSLSCPAERVDLDLFELPAAEKKLEIKSLVFSLAKNVLELQTQVKGIFTHVHTHTLFQSFSLT